MSGGLPYEWVSQTNVNGSILKYLEDRIGKTPPYDAVSAPPHGRLFWQDALADPTGMHAPNGAALDYWLEVQIIDEGVLRKVPTLVQIDVFYRVGNKGTQDDGDRFGWKITRVCDDIQKRLAPLEAGIQLFVFDSDDLTKCQPAPGVYLQVMNQNRINGVFSSRRRLPVINGLQRTALTLDVWHVLDIMSGHVWVADRS